MTLARQFDPRHNAVTALRLALALLVALEHAFELGGYGADPLAAATGVKLGEFAVNSFFAVSGFLVTRSWLQEPALHAYLLKRALRIFPGFWVCLLVTGLGLFPWLAHRLHGTSWPGAALDPAFLGYIWKNSLLKIQQASVGGLFALHPAAGVANGSLWSLLPEFLCYLGVATLGLAGVLRAPRARMVWLAGLAAYVVHAGAPLFWAAAILDGPGWWLWRFSTQAAFFAGGVLLQLHAHRTPVSPRGVALTAGALIVGTALGGYAFVAPVLLPFLLLVLAAKLPGAGLDRLGDYSYGVYVYHYPVEQTFFAFGVVPRHAAGYFALALLATLPLAILSWHLVERPCLRLKSRLLVRARSANSPPAQPLRP